MTVLSSILFPTILKAQKAVRDLERSSREVDHLVFDYRLHRNPTFVLDEMRLLDSLDNVGTKTYLYNGDPIVTLGIDSVDIVPEPGNPYKVDLQIKPLYYAEYGDFREPLRTQLAIGPRLQVNFKHFYAVGQWILPFQNDFNLRLGFGSRPGELGLGYARVLNRVNFTNTFIGTFTNQRYGAYTEYIRMLAGGRFYLGGSFYYTGRYAYDEQILYREVIKYFSGNVFGLYRIVRHDLTLRLTAERFLRDDAGVTFEIFRQFGNTDIGFYGTRSQNGDNAGFFVVFSLWPRKFYANKWLQVRPPHSFRLTYDLRPNTGISERTRPYNDFFYDIYRFNPQYIQNQLTE